MMTARRRTAPARTALAAVAVLTLAGCSGGSATPAGTTGGSGAAGPSAAASGTTQSHAATPAASPGSTTGGTLEMPPGPAGKQLSWLLKASTSLPIGGDDFRAHFSKQFRGQMPAAKFNQILQQLVPDGGLTVSDVVAVTPNQLTARATTTQGELQLLLAADGGTITTLVFRQPPQQLATPTSWRELDRRLAKVAPGTGMLTAELEPDGTCRQVHAVSADTARPLGSMFKLYVLGAVAHAVQRGDLSWHDRLTITRERKSLPSGVLQTRKDGSTVTVREAALKMISLSDNTAADLLAHRVGRQAVEAAVRRMGSRHAQRNVPFLRTRELFVLKGHDYPSLSNAYLARTPSQRRTYLSRTVDPVPRSDIHTWTAPREIDRIEWFASPADLCRAFASLDRLAGRPGLRPVSQVLSANDGGLGLDGSTWRGVWFKGGSEPGVLSLGWRAEDSSGRTFVTVLMAENPREALDESSAASQLVSLAKGAFQLARG